MGLGLFLFIYFQFQIYHELQILSIKEALRKNSQIAKLFLSSYFGDAPDSEMTWNLYCQKIAILTDMHVTLIGEDGGVVADSLHGSNYHIDKKIIPNEYSQVYDLVSSEYILSFAVTLGHKIDNRIVYLRLSENVQNNWKRLRIFLSQSSLAILTFFCIIVLASAIISGIIDQSIQQLINSINEIIAGNSTVKIAQSKFTEFWKLGNSIKLMTDKLQDNQNELRKYNNQWKMIFENMNEGIIVLDHLRNIIVINIAAKSFWNLDQNEEYPGKSVLEVNRDYELKSMIDSLVKSDNHTKKLLELELSSDNNKLNKYVVSGVKLELEKDQPQGLLLVFTDVTRIKELELVRQQFFDNVSHELKTPLTTIQGTIEALPECINTDPTQAAGFIKMIENNTKRINNIIDDLFYLAKLDQGDYSLYKKFEKQNVRDTVQRAVTSISTKIKEKEIDLKQDLNDGDVFGNHGLLEEAIRNILENAVNYSPKKSEIVITSNFDTDLLEIHVKDNGIGIPAQECDRIFERFYRVDKSRDRHTGGSGLGLAIVKHVIQIHNGSITVESQESRGSIFKITLPVSSEQS